MRNLKTVLISKSGERIVLLGGRSSNLEVYGITRTELEEGTNSLGLKPEKLDIDGGVEYKPDEGDGACLLEIHDTNFLLISCRAKKKSFTFDLTRLFDPSSASD